MIMDWILLLKGIIVGIAVSAPLGPMAMMVVQRNLNQGRQQGFYSGLGVAAADTTFAIIAGFGLTVIIGFIREQQIIIQLIGAALLIFLGIRLFTRNPAIERRRQMRKRNGGFWGAFVSMYLLTLSNPVGVFILGGIFAAFGLINEQSTFTSLLGLIIGVAAGATSWWAFLAFLLSRFGPRIRLRTLLWINKIAGLIIIGFGVVILLSLFQGDTRFEMPNTPTEKSQSA